VKKEQVWKITPDTTMNGEPEMQIPRIWVLFGTLILAACPALLVAQTDSGRITG